MLRRLGQNADVLVLLYILTIFFYLLYLYLATNKTYLLVPFFLFFFLYTRNEVILRQT